jgi:hypothetical protein
LGLNFRDQEIASAVASSNAPQVRVLWPNGGEVLSSTEPHTIRWEGSDADNDQLTYLVESSADAGQTWQSLGIVTDQTSLQVTVEQGTLDPSRLALIRVTATDGLNTTSDQSDATFAAMLDLFLPLVLR